jgi:hypothetical protein
MRPIVSTHSPRQVSRLRSLRLPIFLGMALLLLAIAFPAQQLRSLAQGGRRLPVKEEGNRARQLAAPAPNSPTAVPNDTCATPVALSLRQSVSGTLATATNDYQLSGAACFIGIGQTAAIADGGDAVYSFIAPATATYSFKLNDDTGVGDIILYTASTCPAGAPPVTVATCQMAANRNAVQASEEVLCQPMTVGQQVFIFVDKPAASTTSTFKIEVTHCQSETEPNDTPGTANANVFGVEGTITPAADLDYFSLGVTVPGQRIFALVDGSAGNGSDFDLRVTNTTDTLEYDDENNFFPFGNLAPNVGGTPITGVSTFMQVSSFLGGLARQPYRLYTIVEPPIAAAVPETEGNDTIATANSSPLGYYSGTIPVATDTDFYSFNASAGDIIFVGYDGDPTRNATTVDGILVLRDSIGNALQSVNDAAFTSDQTPSPGNLLGNTPNSNAEAFVYRIQTSGTYYVQVNSDFGDTGDYLLAISRNGNVGTGPTASGASITGRIITSNGAPVAGAVVKLSGSQERKFITDAAGNYRFDDVITNGFYTVQPSLANFSFNPSERSFSQTGSTTEAAFTASLSGGFVNPLDTPEYFVRQHYLDFLSREPDESGFNFWSDQITSCGADADCRERRIINVSAAYFLSIEHQEAGRLVDGAYRVSFGRRPLFAEFMPDQATVARNVIVGQGEWARTLEENKRAFVDAWVQRAAFQSVYGGLTNAAYVDALISNTGISFSQSERDALVSALTSGASTRAEVLRQIVEDGRFVAAKRNERFVMMQYMGYLRRDPDADGFAFWLNKLNQFNGNFEQAEMVKAFLVSGEYRNRFH